MGSKNKENAVRIVVGGKTDIKNTMVKSNVLLEVTDEASFGTVEIPKSGAKTKIVNLKGIFTGNFKVSGNSKVNLGDKTIIPALQVLSSKSEANTAKTAEIKAFIVKEGVVSKDLKLSGEGKVKEIVNESSKAIIKIDNKVLVNSVKAVKKDTIEASKAIMDKVALKSVSELLKESEKIASEAKAEAKRDREKAKEATPSTPGSGSSGGSSSGGDNGGETVTKKYYINVKHVVNGIEKPLGIPSNILLGNETVLENEKVPLIFNTLKSMGTTYYKFNKASVISKIDNTKVSNEPINKYIAERLGKDSKLYNDLNAGNYDNIVSTLNAYNFTEFIESIVRVTKGDVTINNLTFSKKTLTDISIGDTSIYNSEDKIIDSSDVVNLKKELGVTGKISDVKLNLIKDKAVKVKFGNEYYELKLELK